MPSIDAIQELLKDEPNDAFLLYGLAIELSNLGRHTEAVDAFDRCLSANPAYSAAYFHKARAQLALDDRAAALATLDVGIAAAEKNGDLHTAEEMRGLRLEAE